VPAGLGTWQFPGPPVPPGSVVVVPNDPSPYETWQEVRNAMEIASNATSTLAQVATLGLNIETYTSLLPFVRQLGQVTLQ
jgi:hypothetical protein